MATTELQTATRPQPGTYEIDPSHSQVSFSARHLMVSKVRGSFAVTGGSIVIAEDTEQSHVEATVDAQSVTSGDAKRDEHLRSADFFAVEQYPTISFRSTKLDDHGDGTFTLDGDLTVRDVTHPVRLEGEYLGTETAPWGTTSIGFSAETEVNRKDWGVEWNVALETGGVLVSEKVKLVIDVEAVVPQADAS
ncbi:MAG TPA: YceI family protein [Acidimicrobiia bacterium]|nr:YceI family protein [Acidimicrobiia bacterium]